MRIFNGIIFTLLFLVHWSANAQTFVPGNSYFGRNNYIEYLPGNLPIVISIPHGGDEAPYEIPDRTCGNETVTDAYTINLGLEIRDAFHKITGCYPYIIICHLKRTKLDANRDLPEAACGNEFAGMAWNEFQNFIDSAEANVIKDFGKGLYIDLHGHGHEIQRLELGYLLTSDQLTSSDNILNTATCINYSSILNLILMNVTNLTHADLIRGIYSLGSMFAVKGFPSVPSIDDPFPLSGQPYFSGGYNIERHGSKADGTIDGIQIECNHDVRFDESTRKDFANNFAIVFLDFLIKHYFPQLPESYCNINGVEQINRSGFLMYPNPFVNILSVHYIMPADMQIYNFEGKSVYSKRIGIDDVINLSQLKSGIYFVTLSCGGKILYRGKLIKGNIKK